MVLASEQAQEICLQVVELGWSGFQEIGPGVLFFDSTDDGPLYVKHKYAPQIKQLSPEYKSQLAQHLQEYDPQKQVIVFDQGKLLVFDVWQKTGKTCEEFIEGIKSHPQPNQRPLLKNKQVRVQN